MANLINEAEIRSTWAPIIEEATGITESSKLAWMSTYCHNHKLYEDANFMALGSETSFNGMNIGGMGAVTLPTPGDFTSTGSGDKAPTLLPLAMQVAAQTIGLDLVPVIPMAGPMGLLSYLDFVYEGGRTDNDVTPTYVKVSSDDAAGVISVSNVGSPAVAAAELVGNSRLDGIGIYKITEAGEAAVAAGSPSTVAGLFTASAGSVEVDLVAALNDHIPGFSGLENADGNLLDAQPYSREVGERTPDKIMGLSLFSKAVEAETFQVAAAVTREQVQDLKQFGVDAVAQVEAVLTNELTQSINSYILSTMRGMAEEGISALSLDYTLGGNTYGDTNRRILTHILAAANLIANRGRRGAGNFAVVDAKVASALQGVAGFIPNPMANTFSQVAGAIYPVGSVAGINVYTDPRLPFDGETVGSDESHEILVGRKGDGNGAGLVFMPYLMAESVQTIAEGTMAPKVAVKSRFALVKAGFHPETQYQKFSVLNVAL